jgi:heme-degrading monooxygenase HmoA
MFAAIYRWRIAPGSEETFRAHWREGTRLIRKQCGGLGSRLHRAPDGLMVAYARWPSRGARDRAFANLPTAIRREIEAMQALVIETLPQLDLEILDDLLAV